jgi:hypothetical protein
MTRLTFILFLAGGGCTTLLRVGAKSLGASCFLHFVLAAAAHTH